MVKSPPAGLAKWPIFQADLGREVGKAGAGGGNANFPRAVIVKTQLPIALQLSTAIYNPTPA